MGGGGRNRELVRYGLAPLAGSRGNILFIVWMNHLSITKPMAYGLSRKWEVDHPGKRQNSGVEPGGSLAGKI